MVIGTWQLASNPIRCRLQSEGWRLWTSILFCSVLGCTHALPMQSRSFLSSPLCCHTQTLRWRPRHLLPSITPSRTLFRMFWCLLTWPKYLSFLDLMSFIRDLVTFRWLSDILICVSSLSMEYGPGVCRSTSRMLASLLISLQKYNVHVSQQYKRDEYTFNNKLALRIFLNTKVTQ